MKRLLVFATVLATANMAYGFVFGLSESAPQTDLGAAIQFTIDITVDTTQGSSGPAPDCDTVTALGLGSPDQPGVATVGSNATHPGGYTNYVSGWNPWMIVIPVGYAIGTVDSAGGAAYDSQWVMDGYDLGGFGGAADLPSPGGVIGTIVVDVPKGNLPLTLEVFAADAVDLMFSVYDAPPTGGSILLPEPGTALLFLVGVLGLIRRR